MCVYRKNVHNVDDIVVLTILYVYFRRAGFHTIPAFKSIFWKAHNITHFVNDLVGNVKIVMNTRNKIAGELPLQIYSQILKCLEKTERLQRFC